MKLTLVTRTPCGLCDQAASALRRAGLPFEPVDVDGDPALLALYNEAVPVLLADGREVCRAPITDSVLRSALTALSA
jgi:glutaredoxin